MYVVDCSFSRLHCLKFSFKLVNFPRSCAKNKRGAFLEHSIYVFCEFWIENCTLTWGASAVGASLPLFAHPHGPAWEKSCFGQKKKLCKNFSAEMLNSEMLKSCWFSECVSAVRRLLSRSGTAVFVLPTDALWLESTVCLKKTGPLWLIWHNFTSSQHLINICGREKPYSILNW